MATLFNGLALLIAATATASASAPPTNLPDPANAELIKLERERNDRVTVPVTIKGQGPFRFMVDTGAQATIVSSALADKLGLTDRGAAVLVGMASRAAVETAEIPQFSLGRRHFRIRNAAIVEGSNLGEADGILGLDSLQDQRVLIDFHKQQIFVADAKHLGGDMGYEIVVKARRRLGQLIITGARLNGIDTEVIIDTGAQASIGNLALRDRLRRAQELGNGTMIDVNGQDLTGAVKVGKKLEIGRMTLSGLPIMFADTPALGALGMKDQPALILGVNELSVFRRVAIDFTKRQVLFDLPDNLEHRDSALEQFFS